MAFGEVPTSGDFNLRIGHALFRSGVCHINIDGRTLWVRPFDSWVLETGNVAAAGMAASLEALLEWAVSFFFRSTELIRELREVITGILEFDD